MSFNQPFGRGYNQNIYGTKENLANPIFSGIMSLPEKVMGLTCLLVGMAIVGILLGINGLNESYNSSLILWIILELVLVVAVQFLADIPGLGFILFLGFGLTTGIVLAPILEIYANAGLKYIIFEALGATAAATAGATLYARTTRRDFSHYGSWLFMALLGFIVALVIGIFIHSTFFQILISGAGCLLFTLYLIYDIQRVVRTANSPGNALRLALKIYLDILNLFINLLSILTLTQGGGSKRS